MISSRPGGEFSHRAVRLHSVNVAESRRGLLSRLTTFGRESTPRRHDVSRAYEPAVATELHNSSLVGIWSLAELLLVWLTGMLLF